MALVQISEPKYKWVCDICGKDIIDFGDMVTIKINNHSNYTEKLINAHQNCLCNKGVIELMNGSTKAVA